MRILIIFFLFTFNLNAAITGSQIEKKAINHYITGDYSAYFSGIIKLIEKDLQSPDSLFYLLTTKIDRNLINNFDRILPYYEKTVNNNNIDLFTRQIILSELADLYINKNEFQKADDLIKRCSYINTWKYTGPFNYSYYNDLDHDFFQIENSILLEDHAKYKWQSLPYKTDRGWVPIKYLSNYKYGTLYAATYFFLPEDSTIIVWLTSNTSIKAFIDHQILFINDSAKYDFHLNNIYKITLKKGWHNLLIKSLSRENSFNFKCRIISQQGTPVKGLKYSSEPKDIIKRRYTSKRILPEIHKYYEKKIDHSTKNVLDYFKYCLLDFHFFNENRALKNLKRFILLKNKNPFLNYLAGRIYMTRYNRTKNNNYLEKAAYYFNRVIETAPDFSRAKQYLIKYQIYKNNPEKAYQLLKKLSGPNYALWGDYFEITGWNMMEYKNYSMEILKNPQKNYYKYLFSNHLENFDINRTLAIYKEQEKNNFQYLNEYPLLDIYLKQNNADDFRLLLDKLLKNNKYNEKYYLYRAFYEKRLKNYDKAAEILKQLLKTKPSFHAAKEMGNIFELKKDIPSALKYYKSAYNLHPSDIKLYKKISYMEKKKIFYSLEDEYYNINTEKIIGEALQDKNKNEDLIKMYLDLMIIKPFPLRGHTYLIHQIYKILDEKGKENFGEIKIPAENSYIVHIKNYIGKGRVLDALDYKKHDNTYYISLPQLKVGSVIDVSYQVFYPYNWMDKTKFFYFTPFSFQEKDFNMKNSILVLVEKENIPRIKYNIYNNTNIEYTREEYKNELIHVWKKKDCAKLKKEYNSVPLFELYPHIYYSSIPDWELFYNWYYGKIRSGLKVSHDIEQKIFDIFERSKEKNKFNLYLYLKNSYYFIQENIIPSYDYLYYPESIEIIYSRLKGNTEEKTLLMYSFLKKLNIDCNIVLVRNNYYSRFDYSIVFPEIFNSILLHIPKQKNLKKDVFLDFSQKYLPCGAINNKYIQTKGFHFNEKNYKFIDTPSLSNKDIIIENYSTVILTNKAAVNGKILYSGLYNINKEQYTDFTERESRILEYINSLINRIAIMDYSILNLNDLDKNLKIEFTGELPFEKTIPVIFDRLELSKRYVSKSKRETPLKIYNPLIKDIFNQISIYKEYNLNLKENHIKTRFGEYRLDVKKDKNSITIKRHISISPQVVNVEDYNDFLKFCTQIDDLEKEKLELKD